MIGQVHSLRRDSRMKRLALLLVAVALLWPAAASAQLTMQMSNGWSFSFAGNVNAFWVFTKRNSSGGADSNTANSSVRTGLLPAFATFEAKGKEAGMNLSVHFGFAPQIQNAGVHDQFSVQSGAAIDMRQVYLTVGGQWGQILAGREVGLFSRQNILNDMTLFGVGAVGIRNGQGGGTAGIRGDFSDLSIVVSGYIGKGLGTTLLFSGGEVSPGAGSTNLRSSDGGYVQLGYTLNKKTTLGASWGFSRLKNNQTGDGNTAVRSNLYSYTFGVYHQWTKSLKLVFEGTQEGTTGIIGGRAPGTKQTDVSGGFMLFF